MRAPVASIDAVLDALVRARVHEALEVARLVREDDPWVAHTSWIFCTSRRAACELARSGAIAGVRRLDGRSVGSSRGGRGVTYVARRSALEAYVAKHSTPVVAKPDDAAEDAPVSGVAGVLAELGLEVANDARRSARGGRR